MLMDQILAESRAGRIQLDPFIYSIQFPVATFVVGATLSLNIPIQADSDFIIRYSTFAAYTGPGVLAPTPEYMLTLFDSGAGRTLQDQPLPILTMLGTAQLPYIWPEPRRLAASSNFNITLTNNDAAPADVWIAFGGFKIFTLQSYAR